MAVNGPSQVGVTAVVPSAQSRAPTESRTLVAPPAAQARAQQQRAPSAAHVDAMSVLAATPKDADGYRVVSFVYDAGPQRGVSAARLHGSWNKTTGEYSTQWGSDRLPMEKLPGTNLWVARLRLKDDAPHDWEWGVYIDTPSNTDKWAILSGSNLKFDPAKSVVSYAPTTYHAMGARRVSADDLSFKVWLPSAKAAMARVTSPNGKVVRYPLQQNGEDWSTVIKGAFTKSLGCAYAYDVTEADGTVRTVSDPYAFAVQGDQRGIGRAWFDPATGAELNMYGQPQSPFMRFECAAAPGADAAYVVVKDASGKPLSRDALLSQLGSLDTGLRGKIVATRGYDDLTSIADDGRLKMTNEDGQWTTLVHNASALHGLRFELQQFKSGVRLQSPDNDLWSDRITERSGMDFRDSVIVDCCKPKEQEPPPDPVERSGHLPSARQQFLLV